MEHKKTQRETSRVHMDGPIFCIILDLLVITGLSWKVLSQEESAVKKESNLASAQLQIR